VSSDATIELVASYDIIGDVHGCAEKLEGLLGVLGYRQRGGVYGCHGHRAVFVGDIIDRGSQQRRTLEIVRAMVEDGDALIVMGNHEFNAVSYATPSPEIPGEFVRAGTPCPQLGMVPEIPVLARP
jgi:hypothetical protein